MCHIAIPPQKQYHQNTLSSYQPPPPISSQSIPNTLAVSLNDGTLRTYRFDKEKGKMVPGLNGWGLPELEGSLPTPITAIDIR